MILLLTCLAGGLGAVTRFVVDALVNRHLPATSLPLGTLVINVTGSFLLGLLTGLAVRHSGSTSALTSIAGTGFCGGYTTFSTASIELVRLWDGAGPSSGVRYAVATLAGSVLAAGVGLLVGGML